MIDRDPHLQNLPRHITPTNSDILFVLLRQPVLSLDNFHYRTRTGKLTFDPIFCKQLTDPLLDHHGAELSNLTTQLAIHMNDLPFYSHESSIGILSLGTQISTANGFLTRIILPNKQTELFSMLSIFSTANPFTTRGRVFYTTNSKLLHFNIDPINTNNLLAPENPLTMLTIMVNGKVKTAVTDI